MIGVRGLYAIIDLGTLERRRIPALDFSLAVLEARPAAVQVRAKGWGAARTLEVLRELRGPASAAGALLFANDRPDLALLAACDGVHLGQEDVPPVAARAVGVRQVGVSTHNAAELDAALGEGDLAYVAIGPVFDTGSKERPDPTLGADGLAQLTSRARARRPELPLVAIGGIDLDSAGAVAAEVDAIAVINALIPADLTPESRAFFSAVRAKAQALVDAIQGARA